MKEGYVIRRGTLDDLPKVISIAQESDLAAHWKGSEWDTIFRTKRVLIVAENCNQVVGFVIAHDVAGEWELENVAVIEEFRQFGIGGLMMESLVNEAQQNHARSIFLEVRESNNPAKRLYERCGFQQYGRRKKYYSNPPEDAVLYRFLCNPETHETC
jgi:[ribosomal protein S18]-alanine N-acetyltransferase